MFIFVIGVITNFNYYLISRQFGTGTPNALDTDKMQAKAVILNQLKLINQLKCYVSKLSNDLNNNSVFENALNKEFAQFLQKIHPKVYGKELVRFFQSETPTIDEKSTKITTNVQSENGLFPGILSDLMGIKSNKEEEKSIPKWKMTKPLVSKVKNFIKLNYFREK